MNALANGWERVRTGRYADAEEICREVLLACPDDAGAWSLMGTIRFRLGRFEEAESSYRRALVARPDLPETHCDLGVALVRQGRLDEAIASFHRTIDLAPGSADAHNNLGMALFQLGRSDAAITSLRQAIRLNPDSAEAQLALGLVRVSLGQFEQALPSLDRAVTIDQNRPEFWLVLARALRGLGRLDDALDSAERALKLNADDARAHCLCGFLLDELRRSDLAVTSFDHAIRLDREDPEAHHNRGVVLAKLGRYGEAIAAFDEAMRLSPDYDEARGNRARALLTLGDFDRTWDELDAETSDRNPSVRWRSDQLWMGEPLNGRTILLHEEQGLGDAIQLIRYAPLVKARGGHVVLVCRRPLVHLAQTCMGIDNVVSRDEPLPPFDVHAPLIRLMCLFTRTVQGIPSTIPYVSADSARVDHWRDRLAGRPGLKVGIAWQGNPKFSRDRDRSFPLSVFETLAAIEGVLLISLQKGFGEEQLRGLPRRFPVLEFGDELDPDPSTIQDTQALMMNLDLVITPDTMLAHLAGALGVAVWIALAKASDWRWLVDRDDSPWYPTARLFRQSERGRWEDVFDRIAAGAEEMVAWRQQSSSPPPGAIVTQDTGCASRPVAVVSPHPEERILHIPREGADITDRRGAKPGAHGPPERLEPGGDIGLSGQPDGLGHETVEVGRDEFREPRLAQQ